jgi:hypothetical protein
MSVKFIGLIEFVSRAVAVRFPALPARRQGSTTVRSSWAPSARVAS